MTEQRKDSLALIHHNYTYHVIITGMRHFKVRQTALFYLMAEMKLELILFWLQVSAFIDLQLCPLEREKESELRRLAKTNGMD